MIYRRLFLYESENSSITYQLNKFYQTVDYGTFLDGKRIVYSEDTWTDYVNDHIRLLSPQQVYKYKIGTCYDTVNYTIHKLELNSIPYRCYYATVSKYYDKERIWGGPTHTFIICKENGKWQWVEGSWGKYMGYNYKWDNPDELLTFIYHCLKRAGQKYIRQILAYPKSGIRYRDFYKQMAMYKTILLR